VHGSMGCRIDFGYKGIASSRDLLQIPVIDYANRRAKRWGQT